MSSNNNTSQPSRPLVNGKKIAEIKREKFRRKAQKKLETEQKIEEKKKWLQKYSDFSTFLDLNDVKALKSLCGQYDMAHDDGDAKRRKRQRIDCSDASTDEESRRRLTLDLIRPYMDLKNSSGSAEQNRYFIAEGTESVRMLIEQSAQKNTPDRCEDLHPIKIHSIITKPSSFFEKPTLLRKTLEMSFSSYFCDNDDGENKTTEATENLNNANISPMQVIVASEDALTEIVGYNVARGAMACGSVTNYSEEWLHNYIVKRQKQDFGIRILALDKIDDTANLGSIIRSSAAFGIHAIVLSDDCCDVFYRRCVRVSMGHALSLPSVRVSNLASTIRILRDKYGIVSYSAVIDKDADMILEKTPKGGISKNWLCVLGNEGNGISTPVVSACNHKIRIDMTQNVDSLSVGVAAGILLHGIREREEI